jgi:hypothetical protein
MESLYLEPSVIFALAAGFLACHSMKPMMRALRSHWPLYALFVEITTAPFITWLFVVYLLYSAFHLQVIQSQFPTA